MSIRYINGRLSIGSILIVDDSTTTRTLVQHILECAQYTVTTATNGAEALSLVQSATFDMIITDFNMPQMDGGEFLKALREDPQTASVPVIMLTSQSLLDMSKGGKGSGANAYIIKGNCDQDLLLGTMRKVFDRALAEQEEFA